MAKILRDCFGSSYVKLLAVTAIVVSLGLLAWGVAPKFIVSALPLLGMAACLLTCLLPLYWFRRSSSSSTTTTPPRGEGQPRSR